jgi:hypothetical protein
MILFPIAAGRWPQVAALSPAAGGGAWTPLDLPSLNRWYDPSDSGTLTVSGSDVSAIADKSGNNFDLGQGTVGRRPQTGGTINGVACLSYDTGDVLNSASITYFDGTDVPFTLFFVAQTTTTATSKFIVAITSSATATPFYGFGHNSTGPVWRAFKRDDANTPKIIGAGTPDTNPHLLTFVCNGTTLTTRVDGADVDVGSDFNVGAITVNRFCIGARNADSFLDGFSGTIGEVIIDETALGSTDIDDCEAYLAAKWGITI